MKLNLIVVGMIAVVCLAGLGRTIFAGEQSSGSKERPADAFAMPVDTSPKIDGRLDDVAWKEVEKKKIGLLDNWHVYESRITDKPLQQPRIGYVCYDKDNLYIAMKAFTPDIYKLKGGTNGNPFLGDCVEIHIKVIGGEYYQWGIDFEGNLAAGKVPEGVKASDIKGESDFGDNFWAAEVAIPWKVLKVEPKTGLRLGFNLAANNAYQGNDMWSIVSWGRSFGVPNAEVQLELK